MASQADIRARIASRIVAALQAKTPPWRRPWIDRENAGTPANAATRRPYRGVNPLLLDLAANERGYQSRWWATYGQWRSLGLRVLARPAGVLPGRWGTRCVYCKQFGTAAGEVNEEPFLLLREFTLFNVDQVVGEGIEAYRVRPGPGPAVIDCGPAEQVLRATKVDLRVGGDAAFYRMNGDFIQLPPKHAFERLHEFYGTALHQLVHWTGHESRLARLDKNARDGDAAYALEMLVAEIGGSYLATELGVPPSSDISNQTAYLGDWVSILRGDPRAVFWVSSRASEAVDFILRLAQPTTVAASDVATRG